MATNDIRFRDAQLNNVEPCIISRTVSKRRENNSQSAIKIKDSRQKICSLFEILF